MLLSVPSFYLVILYQSFCQIITKTCLYNFDPRKPHFYIVKLGFTRVYIIFLIFAQNIYCGCSLELPWQFRLAEAVLKSTHNLCCAQKYEKYQNFLYENFHFLVVKFSVYLNRHVFVMSGLPISIRYRSKQMQ